MDGRHRGRGARHWGVETLLPPPCRLCALATAWEGRTDPTHRVHPALLPAHGRRFRPQVKDDPWEDKPARKPEERIRYTRKYLEGLREVGPPWGSRWPPTPTPRHPDCPAGHLAHALPPQPAGDVAEHCPERPCAIFPAPGGAMRGSREPPRGRLGALACGEALRSALLTVVANGFDPPCAGQHWPAGQRANLPAVLHGWRAQRVHVQLHVPAGEPPTADSHAFYPELF